MRPMRSPRKGVYYIANSVPSATNPTPTWVNITGNIHQIAYSIFGQSYNPATAVNSRLFPIRRSL